MYRKYKFLLFSFLPLALSMVVLCVCLFQKRRIYSLSPEDEHFIKNFQHNISVFTNDVRRISFIEQSLISVQKDFITNVVPSVLLRNISESRSEIPKKSQDIFLRDCEIVVQSEFPERAITINGIPFYRGSDFRGLRVLDVGYECVLLSDGTRIFFNSLFPPEDEKE